MSTTKSTSFIRVTAERLKISYLVLSQAFKQQEEVEHSSLLQKLEPATSNQMTPFRRDIFSTGRYKTTYFRWNIFIVG